VVVVVGAAVVVDEATVVVVDEATVVVVVGAAVVDVEVDVVVDVVVVVGTEKFAAFNLLSRLKKVVEPVVRPPPPGMEKFTLPVSYLVDFE
jgi:hypothetical protein